MTDLFSLLSSPEIARSEDSDEPALDESAELAAPGAAIPNQLCYGLTIRKDPADAR